MNKKVTYIISDIDKSMFFEQTAIWLKEKGFDVSFILINSESGFLHDFLIGHGFIVKNITAKRIIKSLPAILKCRKILREVDPEIVHCHLATANTIGLIAGFIAGVKRRIYTRHNGLPPHYSKKEAILDYLHNILATTIVAATVNTKEILLQMRVKESKIFLLPHGFDIDRMMQPDNKEVIRIKEMYNDKDQYPVIGVVARWLDSKGIQYIIPAFKKLLSQYSNAKLCLFNASDNAPYKTTITQLLTQLPEENYIIVNFEHNVYDLYQLFDIYVHSPVNANYEGFGQTYVESLAAGIPSIFTLSGVAKEFIKNEENALVVNFENSDDIYDAFISLLTNEALVNKLVTNGRQAILRYFGRQQYVENLEKLYA
jgi:glycosyltransferase involved in cell wall biosynthesis